MYWAASIFISVLIVFELHGSTIAQGPPAPANLEINQRDKYNFYVRWTDGIPNGRTVRRYEVVWGNHQTKTVYRSRDSVKQSTKIFNLESNTRYLFRIRSVSSSGGYSNYSEIYAVTLPKRPKSTIWISSTSTSITVQTQPADEGTAERTYIITCKDDHRRFVSNTTTTNTTATVSNLLENIRYRIEVTASNEAGSSQYFSLVSCNTAPTTPGVPTQTSSTSSNVTVGVWSEDSQLARQLNTYYTVQWSPPSLVGRTRSEKSSSSSITISHLQPNTAYTISAIASNEQAVSGVSNTTTMMTLPNKPATPLLTNSTSSTVDLQWIPISEGPLEKLYTVSWYHDTAKVSGVGRQTRIRGNSTKINGLVSNTGYHFQLAAVNSAGSSLKSDGTLIITVPAKANAPTKTATTSSSISIRWDVVFEGSQTRHYKVDWTSSFDNSKGSGLTTETKYTVTDLEPNTAYIFTITARNEAGFGLVSDQVTFETDTTSGSTNQIVAIVVPVVGACIALLLIVDIYYRRRAIIQQQTQMTLPVMYNASSDQSSRCSLESSTKKHLKSPNGKSANDSSIKYEELNDTAYGDVNALIAAGALTQNR